MADMALRTRKLTREKLASFLGAHELIKAFENLQVDVVEGLPAAIDQNSVAIDEVDAIANSAAAQAAVAVALVLAEKAQSQVLQLSGELSALRAQFTAQIEESAAQASIQATHISTLRAQVAQLAGLVNDLQQGYQL